MNNNCNFTLCCLSCNKDENEIKDNYFIRIYIEKYLINEIDDNWKKNYYDWILIFNLIIKY